MSRSSQSPNLLSSSLGGNHHANVDSAPSIVSSSLTITDIHESPVLIHADHPTPMEASESSPQSINASKSNQTNQDKNLNQLSIKTEYKSNFTPFDQYVYNEVTDSFVRATHFNKDANQSLTPNHQVDGSSSNQDLHSLHDPNTTASLALEVGSFEPLMNGGEYRNNVNEPWYKEVVKRNEKANEYRFKSEVGHNSPLSKLTDENLTPRMSPLGNDPLIEAQIRDHKIEQSSCPSNATKANIRFSSVGYKRDHLIAYMANNNNFKLPKDQETTQSGRAQLTTAQPRRINTTNSRATAHTRARSQSSKRQPLTSIAGETEPPTSKSNQTTPTKSASASSRLVPTSNRNGTGHAASVAKSHAATSTKSTPNVTGKSSNQNEIRRPLTATTTRKAASNPTKAPVAKTSSAAIVRSGNIAGTSISRPKPAASNKSLTRVPLGSANRIQAVNRTAGSVARNRSPVAKRFSTSSTTGSPSTSRPKTSLPSALSSRQSASANLKPAPSSPRASASKANTNNEVRSIKTPKALASVNAKALVAPTATMVAAKAPIQELAAFAENSESNNPINKLDTVSHISQDFDGSEREQIPLENTYVLQEEQNLITTTTEGGNMLADELAEAELAACETAAIVQMPDHSRGALDKDSDPIHQKIVENFVEKDKESDMQQDSVTSYSQTRPDQLVDDVKIPPESQVHDLVNGLEGGLVSTEDRFDSSERGSIIDQKDNHHLFQAYQEHQALGEHRSDGDEPYSLIPSAYDNSTSAQDEIVTSSIGNNWKSENKQELSSDAIADGPSKPVDQIVSSSIVEWQDNSAKSIESESEDRFKTLTLETKQADIESMHETGSQIQETEMKEDYREHEDQEEQQKSDNQEALQDFRDKFSEDGTDWLEPNSSTNSDSERNISSSTDGKKMDDGEFTSKILNQPVHQETMPDSAGIPPKTEGEEARFLESAKSVRFQEKPEEIQPSNLISSTSASSSTEILKSDFDQDAEYKINLAEQDTYEAHTNNPHDSKEVRRPTPAQANEYTSATEKTACMLDTMNPVCSTNQNRCQSSENLRGGYVNDDNSLNKCEEIKEETDSASQTLEPLVGELNEELVDGGTNTNAGNVYTNPDPVVESAKILVRSNNTNLTDTDCSFNDADSSGDIDQSEIVMNVADLIDVEMKKKQEMARKSELARQLSGSLSSSNTQEPHGEILLSADQLSEHFAQLSGKSTALNPSKFDSDIGSSDSRGDREEHNYQPKQEKFVIINEGSFEQSNSMNSDDKVTQGAITDPSTATKLGDSEIAQEGASLDKSSQSPRENKVRELQGSLMVAESNLSQQEYYETLNKQMPHVGELSLDQGELSELKSVEGRRDTHLSASDAEMIDQSQEVTRENESESDLVTGLDFGKKKENSEYILQAEQINPQSDINITTPTIVQEEGDRNASQLNITSVDDIDDEEHLKLSNHLTNSDDELILEPRGTAATISTLSSTVDPEFNPHRTTLSSRYNEGAGLGPIYHDECIEADSAELGDGTTAEIIAPTVAENRVEVATSKSSIHELTTAATFIHAPKLMQDSDSDEEDVFDVMNPNADPIDVAATMSSSSSVAEEMLRLSRKESNSLLDELDVKISTPASPSTPSVPTLESTAGEVQRENPKIGTDVSDVNVTKLAKVNVDTIVASIDGTSAGEIVVPNNSKDDQGNNNNW